MCVKIRIPTSLQQKVDNKTSIDVLCNTAIECLEELVQRYPLLKGEIIDSQGMILVSWMVIVNNTLYKTSELKHPLNPGDVIVLAPVIAGG